MIKQTIAPLLATVVLLSLSSLALANDHTDDAIKKKIIQSSIARYSGNCPCPYNTDSAGRQCGKRSAYSRPGGYSPICYSEDVTQQMIKAYKQKNR